VSAYSTQFDVLLALAVAGVSQDQDPSLLPEGGGFFFSSKGSER
jgi:hypothetical protein